jgi:hypothetical protein
MTDRELLEAAAKAAGIVIDKSPYNGGGDGNDGFDVLGNAVLDWHNGTKWNPLTDDGDALRLAVKLKLLVNVSDFFTHATNGSDDGEVLHGDDAYAATRRAIVLAAAEIGKEKA